MPSRDIFTVLSLSSNYTNDILVSVHAFSALRSWLLYILEKPDGVEFLNIQSSKITSRLSDTNSKHEGSPLSVSGSHFYRDLSSDSETGSCSSLVSSMASFNISAYNNIERMNSRKRSVTQQSLLTSDSRSQTPIYNRTKQFDSVSITSEILSNAASLESLIIRYCLRIISQSEKVPKRDQDRSIITSSVVECINILHLLCREDSFASQKIYREMRRLYNRIEKDPLAARRVYKSLIEFFIQHHQEVLFPIDNILEHYLKEVPSKYYHRGTDSFEVIHLLTNNKQYFREKFQIVSKFLPNILKLIVWWPLVFIENFKDIVRVLLTKQNFLEMFHAILDAPCLVTLMHLKHEKFLEDDAKLKEIFKVEFKPYFRIMFAFILRSESTGADTIDKLKHLYDALEPLKQLPRVKYVTNIVPILLLHYFDSVYNMHDKNLLRNLYPVILERMFLFYPYSNGNLEVHEILFGQLSYISKLIPDVIHQHFEDVLAFLNRIQYSELYIPQLVCKFIYSLGESLTNGSCTGEEVYKFYEQLETIIYESSQKLASSNNMSHPEVFCSLACSIAKCSAYSQDLVQRSLVCLNKILLINYATVSDSISYEDFITVQTVAYQKIKVLQKPNVAAALLCGLERETPWHLDSTSSPTLKVHYLLRNSSLD